MKLTLSKTEFEKGLIKSSKDLSIEYETDEDYAHMTTNENIDGLWELLNSPSEGYPMLAVNAGEEK